MCGTPNYISPEIAYRKSYDFASDIWAVGCILFSCLAGYSPFESSSVKNTLDNVKRGVFTLPDWLSPAASDLISRCLAWDPKDRPNTEEILSHKFMMVYTPRRTLKQVYCNYEEEISPEKDCPPLSQTQPRMTIKSISSYSTTDSSLIM